MADQVYQFVVSYTCGGQFCQTVHHFRFEDGGFDSTFSAAEALNTAMNASRKGVLITVLPTSTTITSFKSRRVTGGGGLEAILNQTAGNVGTRAGTISLSGAAPCVIGFPALPTTRKRARMFLPGVSETDLVDGIFSVSYKAAVEGAFGTLFDPIALTGGGAPTATYVIKQVTAGASIPITDWELSTICGTIRRRQVPV